jgi:RecA-family ATPase
LKHYNADFPDLQGIVHLLSFVGEDAVLGLADHTGVVKPTPLFMRLLKAAKEIKPVLIGIDTSADVFAGNENDRSQVRQFVGLLRRMAMAADAYVLVNSHPSLTGINSGTGMSGSTGWHNSVRARAYLTTPKAERDEEPDDPDARVLEFKKSNYGPISTSIALRWEHGVWVPASGAGALEQQLRDRKIDDLFLSLLDRFTREGRHVSDKHSSSYAPTRFVEEPEAAAAKATSRMLEAAMRRLFAAGKIQVVTEGPASRKRSHLVAKGGE